MAKKQVKVEIVGDSSQFNQSMDQASRRVRDFGHQAQTASSGAASFMGSVKAMTASLGLADAACKVVTAVIDKFNDAVLHSSQTLGDQMATNQEAVNTAINEFAYALVNADFTNFNMGLDDLITRAHEAYAAIDQLGNSTMSLGVIQAKYGADLNQSLANLRGLKKGTAEYTAEMEKAQKAINMMKKGSEIVQGDIVKALQTQLSKDTGVKWDNIKLEDIEDVAMRDADVDRDEIKQKAAAAYEEYQKAIADLNRQHTETVMVGFGEGTSIETRIKDQDKYNAAVAALNDQYKDSILQNAMLNKYTDEQLKNLDAQLSAYYGLNSQASQYQGTLNRLNKGNEPAAGPKKPDGKPEKMTDLEINVALANDPWRVIDSYLQQKPPVPVQVEPVLTDEEGNITLNTEYAMEEPDMTAMDELNDSLTQRAELYQLLIDKVAELESLRAVAHGEELTQIDEQIEATERAIAAIDGGQRAAEKHGDVQRKAADQTAKSWMGAGKTFQAVGGMMNDENGKVVAGIGNVMTSIAQLIPMLVAEKTAETGKAIASGTAKVASTATTWYEIIPGIAAVASAIISTLAGFEKGGVVGGTSYHGDNVLVRVNSGERILTQKQNAVYEQFVKNIGGNINSVTASDVANAFDSHDQRKIGGSMNTTNLVSGDTLTTNKTNYAPAISILSDMTTSNAGDVIGGSSVSNVMSLVQQMPLLMAQHDGSNTDLIRLFVTPNVAGFATGGVIPGSSMTGDKLLIRANSGERILTAEQNEWFETLANGGGNTSQGNGNGEIRVRIRNNELTGTLRNASNRQRYRY